MGDVTLFRDKREPEPKSSRYEKPMSLQEREMEEHLARQQAKATKLGMPFDAAVSLDHLLTILNTSKTSYSHDLGLRMKQHIETLDKYRVSL